MVVRYISFVLAVASAFHISPKPFFLDHVNSTSQNNGSLKNDLEPKETPSDENSNGKIDGFTWWDILAILVILLFIVLYAMVSCYMDMSMNDIDFGTEKDSPRSDVMYPLLPDLKTT